MVKRVFLSAVSKGQKNKIPPHVPVLAIFDEIGAEELLSLWCQLDESSRETLIAVARGLVSKTHTKPPETKPAKA